MRRSRRGEVRIVFCISEVLYSASMITGYRSGLSCIGLYPFTCTAPSDLLRSLNIIASSRKIYLPYYAPQQQTTSHPHNP